MNFTWTDNWTFKGGGSNPSDLSADSATPGAKTYRPSVNLLVGKNVYRDEGGAVSSSGYEGAGAWDDLSRYLGDGGSVSISKSIYKPCGSFVITIPDAAVSPLFGGRPVDSLHALLEPVDGMDIYLARNQHEYAGGLPPIMMRGFVRDVVRQESITNGRPHRVTTITGQDYGACFDFLRLCMVAPGLLGIPDRFKALFGLGMMPGPMPIQEFYEQFVELANIYLDGLWEQGGWTVPLEFDCQVTDGLIPMIGLNAHEGPFWGLMLREMDSPWNELFIEEREDAPYLVYRPTPWKGLDGAYIENVSGPVTAYTASIDIADITSLVTHRGDYDAGNLFYTDNPVAIQSGLQAQALAAAATGEAAAIVQDDGYQNNDRNIYGDRLIRTSFRQWPNNTIENPITANKSHWESNGTSFMDWWKQRTNWLRLANRDNVVFESGSMTVKGSEHIRPGMYLQVNRGSFQWECYVTSVQHTFVPFGPYTTAVEFIRGTGFNERLQSGASPYLREGKRGPYDPL
jgi:hypothetical protein